MITSIVFSRNRALQLDLTLKSIKKNLQQSENCIVIYKADLGYEEAYNILKREHSDVVFHEQKGYLLDAIMIHQRYFSKLLSFFTDDNIVYKVSKLTKEQLDILQTTKEACCLSLRLGYNTQMRDYGAGKLEPDNVPDYYPYNGMFTWNRLSIPPGGYWAYPLSVDGHIFRTKDMLDMLNTMNNWPEMFSSLQTPNKFEAMLQRFFFEIPPMMLCEKYSSVVNSPNNRVQDEYTNQSGVSFSYEAMFLNDLFMAGRRIDLNALSFGNIVCPHQEIDILTGLV